MNYFWKSKIIHINRKSSCAVNKLKFLLSPDLLKNCQKIYFLINFTNLLVAFLREELTVALTLITNLILKLKLSNQTQSCKMAGVSFLDCGPH